MIRYCLFCNTAKARALASAIETRFGVTAIAPRIVQRKWVRGVPFDVVHDYLPGYLFLYAQTPIDDFRALRRMSDVYRVLGSEDQNYQLSGADGRFADMLFEKNGVIGSVPVYREGDRVKLRRDGFHGVQAEIVKVDARRGRLLLRYRFDASDWNVWVGYELVE